MKVLKLLQRVRGFALMPIHYTHDPEKATPEWLHETRSTFPRPMDFDREYEIDFGLKIGAPAYPAYDDVKHLKPGLLATYDPRRPLHVGFDFNVNPMSIVCDQVDQVAREIRVIKSFVYDATIDSIVNDFRDFFSNHRADVHIYGDATKGTNAQTARSNWDVVRMAFRGYQVAPEFHVPLANPHIGDRLNAVNRILRGGQGYVVLIDPDENEELVRDLREVILSPDGKRIHKVTNMDDPYYLRTHASDAWGYRIFRQFSVMDEVISEIAKKRAPMQPGSLLGEVQMGSLKEEAKRKPIDKGRTR